MVNFTLYGTLGCHLCELAEAMLLRLQKSNPLTFDRVEIADSDELMELYGVRIPVLVCAQTQRELGWPFTDDELAEWLNKAQ